MERFFDENLNQLRTNLNRMAELAYANVNTAVQALVEKDLDLVKKTLDADEEIEEAAGMSVADYFEQYGEPAFREGERRVIARLLDEAEPIVLATGGGAYMDAETRATIQQKATSVWLKADLDLLVARTSKRNTRPLLRQGNSREILKDLMDKRYPVYAQSDVTVETGNVPHEAVVDLILAALKERTNG